LKQDSALSYTAFLALLAGSFTKAGAFPFHSWIPDYTKSTGGIIGIPSGFAG
jgi:formate hydrogenlyase subunit 3/multisubunit Na+/H+ antiporter MnhD subunit